jgi:hypothetical protein
MIQLMYKRIYLLTHKTICFFVFLNIPQGLFKIEKPMKIASENSTTGTKQRGKE